jgi:hypothetical protein
MNENQQECANCGVVSEAVETRQRNGTPLLCDECEEQLPRIRDDSGPWDEANDWNFIDLTPAALPIDAMEKFAESAQVTDIWLPAPPRVDTTTILPSGETVDGDIRRFCVELETECHDVKMGNDGWWYWTHCDAPPADYHSIEDEEGDK